jgi:hypothetical protein
MRQTIILLVIFFGNISYSLSQNISIYQSLPNKGGYGELDTITGNNFDTTVNQTHVFIGKAKCTTLSVTHSRIIFRVPTGAISDFISVTSRGQTVKYHQKFMVLLIGSTQLTPSNLFKLNPINGGGASSSVSIACDINNDFKTDYIKLYFTTVLIYINQGKTTISDSSFSAPIAVSFSTYCSDIIMDDIDNDGKKDLILVASFEPKIVVIKNNYTSGPVLPSSFGTAIEFIVTGSPKKVVSAELNGDGRLDLLITYKNENTFQVLRNTTVLGAVNFDTLPKISTVFNSPFVFPINYNNDRKEDLVIGGELTSAPGNSRVLRKTNTSVDSIVTFSVDTLIKNMSSEKLLDLVPANIDGDTVVDFIYITKYGSFANKYVMAAASRNNSLKYGFDNPLLMYNSTFTNQDEVVFDFDGDGFDDIVIQDKNQSTSWGVVVKTVKNIVNNTFSFPGTLFNFDNVTWGGASSVVLDIDNNGTLDLIDNWNATIWFYPNTILASRPDTIPSQLKVVDSNSVSVFVKVKGGSGNRILVVAKKNSPVLNIPLDGFAYNTFNGNFSFGLGDSIGLGEYIVYNGGIDSFLVTNLAPNSNYHLAIFEYNIISVGTTSRFNKTPAVLAISTNNAPTIISKALAFSQVTDSSFRITFRPGNGNKRYVTLGLGNDLYNKGYIPYPNFSNSYNTSLEYEKGTNLGLSNYAMYYGADTVLTFTNLYASTNFFVCVFEVNEDSNGRIEYRKYDFLLSDTMTLNLAPRIDSIVPIKAQPGELITLYGKYFDRYNKDRIIFRIGNVKAKVYSTEDNKVQIIVPNGATHDFISFLRNADQRVYVGNNNYTNMGGCKGWSKKRFQPYTLNNSELDSNSFAGSYIGAGTLTNVKFGDLDQDEKPEFVYSYSNSINREAKLTVRRNISTFSELNFNQLDYVSQSFMNGYRHVSLHLSDIDSDGDLDIMTPTITGTNNYYENKVGLQGFGWNGMHPADFSQQSLPFTLAYYPSHFRSQDFNEDGKEDYLMFEGYSLGTPINSFKLTSLVGSLDTGSRITAVMYIDIDNDNKVDLVSCNSGENKIALYKNLGGGAFASAVKFTCDSIPFSLAIGDINNDGKEDIVVGNIGSKTLTIFQNQSSVGVIDSNSLLKSATIFCTQEPKGLNLSNISGDDKLDLTVANGSEIVFYTNKYSSGLIDTSVFGQPQMLKRSYYGPDNIDYIDLNKDGLLELITYNQSYSADIYRNISKSFVINPIIKKAYCKEDSIKIIFKCLNYPLDSNNIFTLQLSDSNGQFVTPINLYSLLSAALSDTFNIKLPAGLSTNVNYKFRVLASSSNIISTVSPFAIFIHPTPNLPTLISNNQQRLCNFSNDSVAVLKTINNSYYWLDNIGAEIINSSSIHHTDVRYSGFYKLKIVNEHGCNLIVDSILIKKFDAPSTTILSNINPRACKNDTVILSVVQNTTNKYRWFMNDTLLLADTTSSFKAVQSGHYKSMITDSNNCKSITQDTQVLIQEFPITVNFAQGKLICNADSVSIGVNVLPISDYSFKWYRNDSLLSNILSSNVCKTAGNYRSSIKNIVTGCSQTIPISAITQVILPKPEIVSNKPLSICSSDSVRFDAIGGEYKYKWLYNSVYLKDSLVSLNAKNAGRYAYEIIDSNRCKRRSIDTILVTLALPSAPLFVSGSLSICMGDSTLLSTISDTSIRVSWFKDSIVVPNFYSHKNFIKEAGKYFVVNTASNGCKKQSIDKVLVTLAVPSAPLFVSGSLSICTGDSALLSTISDTSIRVSWYKDSIIVPNVYTHKNFIKDAGKYFVVNTANNGCKRRSDDTMLVTLALPNASLFVSGSLSICKGDSTELSTILDTSIRSSWFKDSIVVPNVYAHRIFIKESGKYFVVNTASNGCKMKSNESIIIENPLPNYPYTITRNVVCNGDSARISVTDSIGFLFEWYKDGLKVLTANKSYYYVTDTSRYSVGITNNNGCKNLMKDTQISINPNPEIDLNILGNANFCEPDSAMLFTISDNTNSIQWFKNDSLLLSVDTFLYAKSSGSYNAVASNRFGCYHSSNAINIISHSKPTTPIIIDSGIVLISSSIIGNQWFLNKGVILGANNQNYNPISGGLYQVIVTDSNGCVSDTSLPYNWMNTSVNNMLNAKEAKISVYPNPITSDLFIRSDKVGLKSIFIYDVYGRLLYHLEDCVDNKMLVEIDLTKFVSGIYKVLVYDELSHSHIFNVLKN